MTDAIVTTVTTNIEDGEEIDPTDETEEFRSVEHETVTRRVEFRSVGDVGDGLTLCGYAAVFDDAADILDPSGRQYHETIQRGAFKKTLSERKPALLFDHGRHPMIGTMPIGNITQLREDSKGLYVEARMADNWLVQPVRDAIATGSVDGMSVRMTVIKDQWKRRADRSVDRSVSEVALLELGPVVFPAYANAKVSLRSREVITALADPEVRSEIAQFAAGTEDFSSAAGLDDESVTRSRIAQNQAKAKLALLAVAAIS